MHKMYGIQDSRARLAETGTRRSLGDDRRENAIDERGGCHRGGMSSGGVAAKH